MPVFQSVTNTFLFRLAAAATGLVLLSAFSILTIDRLKYPLHALSKKVGSSSALLTEAIGLFTPLDLFLGFTSLLVIAYIAALEFRDGRLSEAILKAPTRYFLLLVLGMSLWFVHSYFNPGLLLSGDTGSHIARTAHVRMGLEEGRFIYWNNYFYTGSAFLQFTGPLYFWITGLLDVVINDPDLANKLFLAVLHFLSGAFLFGFLKEKGLERYPALIGALAYGGAFAHIHLILWKGAYPQAITMALLPLAFWLAERVLSGTGRSRAEWAGLTITNALLLINHQATGMFAGVFLAIYLAAGFVMGSYKWQKLLPLAISGAVAILISLFAVVPILLEREHVMMYGSTKMLQWIWPNLEYFKNMLIWRNTGIGSGTASEAYVGLTVIVLAVIGLIANLLQSQLRREFKKLAVISAIGLFISFFLRGPHVRDIIFTLFFLAVLAGIGASRILKIGFLGKSAPALIILVLLVDIGTTAIQPLARTDKEYFRTGADYLSQFSTSERMLQSYSGGKDITLSIGPSGSPLQRFPIQQLIGAHNLEATLGHNFVAAIIKRAQNDLQKDRFLSSDTLSLLGFLNVTRIVNDTGSGLGFDETFSGGTVEGPLGRVLRIPNATPFVFSQKLVEYGPRPDLEKPILWNESFESQEQSEKITAINAYLEGFLAITGPSNGTLLANAIPVQNNQGATELAVQINSTRVDVRSEIYRVGIDRVELTLQSSHAGYAMLSHPWYPYLRVTRNSQRIEPLRSSLNFMVVPVMPGINAFEIVPQRSAVRTLTGWFCFLLFLTVIAFGVIGQIKHGIKRNNPEFPQQAAISQFLLFAAVGAIGTVAHYLVLIFCVSWLHTDAVLGSVAGFVTGAFVNYLLNYHVTFRSDKKHREAMTKFFTVAILGLVLNTLIMAITHRIMGLHYLLGQVIATLIVLFSNYFANRAWTFNVSEKK